MNHRFLKLAFFVFASMVAGLWGMSVTEAQEDADRFAEYKQLYTESGNSASDTGNSGSLGDFGGFSGMAMPGFGMTAAPTLNVTAKVSRLPQNGEMGEIEIFAEIPEGFKIYSLTQEAGGPFPTKVHLPNEVEIVGEIVAEPKAHTERDEATWGDMTIESHKKSVKWVIPFQWKNKTESLTQVTGSVEAQMCDADSCLPPKKFPFTAAVPVVAEAVTENKVETPMENEVKNTDITENTSVVVPVTENNAGNVAEVVTENKVETPTENSVSVPTLKPAEPVQETVVETTSETVSDLSEWEGFNGSGANYSVAIILVMAYLGGLILNLMPCVLPVIAPKLHSFVKQSGEARGRVFLLNVAYTLGLLTVLWLLATLSRIADLMMILRGLLPESAAQYLPEIQNMGWGQQFTYPGFVIFMISLVFIMGLSFLGVWEIPIPGMATSGKLSKMQRKEGYLGAYCMGILTTLLATPCVGPYLGTVFGWVMTQQVWMSFVVFTVIGLGLGTPYLLIGAVPELIRFLPKPGEWMETLKEVMGFFFLGTVVWLFYVLPDRYCVQTLGFLVSLWFACWLVGKTTLSGASREAVLTAWAAGLIVVALCGFLFFSVGFGSRADVETVSAGTGSGMVAEMKTDAD
ncbi:MAG: cytochrome c biogenesis protein CcdA, partial [Planctomycetia bacterium]|nr:cytochrome c biogenesis protein CcdA [Planctomycetia bacterium]